MKALLKLSILVTLLIVVVIGCQKTLSDVDNTDAGTTKLFNTNVAKEWWYGSFKKSGAYTLYNKNSILAVPQGNSISKYPNWSKAISYNLFSSQYVEIPLYYTTNNILLPHMQSLSKTPEGERIARACIHKLILIRNSQGVIFVRTVTIIPSASYANTHNYDISNIHPNKLPLDFDGFLIIAEWDETEKNTVRIEKGKIVKKIHFLTAQQFANYKPKQQQRETTICPPPLWVPDFVWVCAIVPTGDAIEDEQHCQEIGHWVEVGGAYVYPDCYDDGDEGEECYGLTSEECMCQLYGSCGGGDGDEDTECQNISNSMSSMTESILNDGSSILGAESVPDAFGEITAPKPSTGSSHIYSFFFNYYQPSWACYYTGTVYKIPTTADPNPAWKWKTFEFNHVARNGGSLPTCITAASTSNIVGTIDGDEKNAHAAGSFQLTFTVTCLYSSEVTVKDVNVYEGFRANE